MTYNYFVCRKCNPPVTYAALANATVPTAYASPMCPACGKTMQHYGHGNSAVAPPPPPVGPGPAPFVPVVISNADVPIYAGWGINPGHSKVTWDIFRNAAKLELTIALKFGDFIANAWGSVKTFRMVDGTLNLGQGGLKQDWWLGSPTPRSANPEIWHSFSLVNLVGPGGLGAAPAVIDIGVKLGNAAFGLIHLLAGHSDSIVNIGTYSTMSSANAKENEFRAIMSLQSGLRRFDQDQIRRVNYDPIEDKFLLQGQFSGLIVLRRMPGDPRYAITTIFNKNPAVFGATIYEA